MNIHELADIIYNDLAPWEKEEETWQNILDTLENDPLEVVKYLVDRFIEEV